MMLLGVTFKEFIQKTNVIGGIILAIIGVAIWLLAKNIAQVVRKGEPVKPNDAVLIGWKVAGLVALLIGMVLIAIPM